MACTLRRAWINDRPIAVLVAAAFVSLPSLPFLACTKPGVESEHRPGYEIGAGRRLRVEVDASGFGAAEGSIEELEDALRSETSRLLADWGHRLDGAEPAELVISVDAAIETELRRTWTSEPGVSEFGEVEREAVVVRIRAVDVVADHDVWRSEARSVLPRNRLPFMPDRSEVCLRTLAAALGDFAPAPAPTPAEERDIREGLPGS